MKAALVFIMVLATGPVSWASGQCVSSRVAAQLAYDFLDSSIEFRLVSQEERYDITNNLTFASKHRIYGYRGYFSTLRMDSRTGEQMDIQVDCLGEIYVLDSRNFH